MLIVLPVCRKDAHLALASLRLVARLDPQGVPFPLLITTELGFAVKPIVEAAKPLFASVRTHVYDPCPHGLEFPKPQNHAWQQSARAVTGIPNTRAWLWWEPDAVPTCPGWATLLWKAYQAGRKPAAGAVVRKGSGGRSYLAGVAIYPADASVRYENAMMTREAPFDMVASILDGLLAQSTDLSPLITHDYRADGAGRTWSQGDQVPEGVALWHRCEDASLQALLLGEARPAPPPGYRPPLLLQLGRAGDLLNLVPLARKYGYHILCREEYQPLLERFDVTCVPWDGSLEDVPGARRLAGTLGYDDVRVTQAFGNVPRRDPDHGSFCREAWARAGHLADWGQLRMPSPARDSAAEAKVLSDLKVQAPYVVLCTAGTSSPPNEQERRALESAVGAAGVSVVDVSKYRAPNLLDMLGLLEGAACIVTADTSLVHLNRAVGTPCVHFGRGGWLSTGIVEGVAWCDEWRRVAARARDVTAFVKGHSGRAGRLMVACYMPPSGVGQVDLFRKHLADVPPRVPMVLVEDSAVAKPLPTEHPALATAIMDAVVNRLRHEQAQYVMLLEPDCRLAAGWDTEPLREALRRCPNFAAAGTPVAFNTEFASPVVAAATTLLLRDANERLGSHIYPLKDEWLPRETWAVFPNGALALYDRSLLVRAWDATAGWTGIPWDMRVGLGMWRILGGEWFARFVPIGSVASFNGECFISRQVMKNGLVSGRWRAIHNIKDAWVPCTS